MLPDEKRIEHTFFTWAAPASRSDAVQQNSGIAASMADSALASEQPPSLAANAADFRHDGPHDEDFAESVASYVVDRDAFANKFPNRAAIIQEILLKQEESAMAYYYKMWGPTPGNGAYHDIYFLDDNLKNTREALATWCRIHEYTASGHMLMSTMGICDPDVGEDELDVQLPVPVYADPRDKQENDRKWARNIRTYRESLDPGKCPVCGSGRINEARFIHPRGSFTLACHDCKATVHFDGSTE